jgi:hypothetical protein
LKLKRPTEENKVAKEETKEAKIEHSKLQLLQAYQRKLRQELWCKAMQVPKYADVLKHPTYATVKQIRSGEFKQRRVPWCALEVVAVETVGNQF